MSFNVKTTDANGKTCIQPVSLSVLGALGACCPPSGACYVTTESACLAAGGTWNGAGSTCANYAGYLGVPDVSYVVLSGSCGASYTASAGYLKLNFYVNTGGGAIATNGPFNNMHLEFPIDACSVNGVINVTVTLHVQWTDGLNGTTAFGFDGHVISLAQNLGQTDWSDSWQLATQGTDQIDYSLFGSQFGVDNSASGYLEVRCTI